MRFINGRVWLFVMLVLVVVSSFYFWQVGQKPRRAYAGGRIVERPAEQFGQCECV